jgi:hypothetical protein
VNTLAASLLREGDAAVQSAIAQSIDEGDAAGPLESTKTLPDPDIAGAPSALRAAPGDLGTTSTPSPLRAPRKRRRLRRSRGWY